MTKPPRILNETNYSALCLYSSIHATFAPESSSKNSSLVAVEGEAAQPRRQRDGVDRAANRTVCISRVRATRVHRVSFDYAVSSFHGLVGCSPSGRGGWRISRGLRSPPFSYPHHVLRLPLTFTPAPFFAPLSLLFLCHLGFRPACHRETEPRAPAEPRKRANRPDRWSRNARASRRTEPKRHIPRPLPLAFDSAGRPAWS